LQKKYEEYIDSVDALRDTLGKLKVQSTKMRDDIGKWKHKQRISTELLDEYLKNDDLSYHSPSEDDCLEASSNAPTDEHYENYDDYHEHWYHITHMPAEHRKCHFVHHEHKSQAKPRYPVCPIQNRKRVIKEHASAPKCTSSMETPIMNENSFLFKEANDLQNNMQYYENKKASIEEKIAHSRREIRSLIRQDVHYDTLEEAEKELSSLITEGAWIEKKLVQLSSKINEIPKRQGFTEIARTFMATAVNQDEPFQITTSHIQQTGSDDDPFNDILYYENTELKEDNIKLKTATAQLQEELEKIKAELTQIYINLNNADQIPATSIPAKDSTSTVPTGSVTQVQDLLSSTEPQLTNSNEATLQARLAKELIKLANSYKIPELTFDIQASKRRFNFSTWFSKLQNILSMFPQTSSVVDDSGTIIFYSNSNDFGNKALYLLIGATVDNYFQRAIRHFAGQGDKALAFIQSQCANVSNEDKSHFHHAFTTLRIKENESATSFIKCFIFAKTEAKSAANTYIEHDLVSFVLTGLGCSKNPKYDTALQLYQLEREHGKMSFTLEDIEKRFFSLDEQAARERALTRIVLGNAVTTNSNRGSRQQTYKRNHNKNELGRKSNASAHATSKPIICYNCGEKDHISPNCPHPKVQKENKVPFKSTAKGRSATATTSSTEDTTALVSTARVVNYVQHSNEIHLEHEDTIRPTSFPSIHYTDNADLASFLNCTTFATLWVETFDHFKPQVDTDPKTEVFLHDRPMEEDLIDAASIFVLNYQDSIKEACRQIIKEGVMPAVQKVFVPQPWNYPVQFHLWLETLRFFIQHKLLELQYIKENVHLMITTTDNHIQLTFYPTGGAYAPTLHHRVSTGRYCLSYAIPSYHAQAAMAKVAPEGKSHTPMRKLKDPSVVEIGDPSNLNNYLPDSGATQHMTPRLADL
jgi:hypothetical protein